ncbi:MAG: carboxypeptidase regulatory-like domain-containing protein [Candidatus Methanomethylophilaceae archaeon]
MNRTSASIALFAALLMIISAAVPLSSPGDDAAAGTSDLPSSYDLRDYGLVTSVKDQGNYNTCWAFAFISCVETNLIKKGYADLSIDLSEYQLVYYLIHYTEGPIGGMEGDVVYRYDGQIINGGRLAYTVQDALQWRGLVYETDLKYGLIDERSTINPIYEFDKTAYIVTSARMVEYYDMDSIKRELLNHNSLVTTIPYIKSDFKIVTDENGNDSLTFYAPEDLKEGYHAVTLVGYDDNYPRENFATDPGCDGAWLIKNSFGTSMFEGNVMHGYDGYIWVSYNSVISFERYLASVEAEPASTFDKNYQYDGGVESGTVGTNSDEVSSANVFKAVDDGVIRNICFSASPDNDAQYGYSVSVYTGLTDPNDPCSGTLAAGPISGSGYHGTINVDLGRDVPISKGELFSVVVTTDAVPSTGHEGFTKMSPVTYDADLHEDLGFIIQTTEKPGESFIKHGEGGWTDLYDVGNLRIKAYVCDYRAVDGTVTDGTGAPVASATVTIVSDGAPYVAVSGSDGRYSLKVPSGTCTVTAGKEGYCLYTSYDVRIYDDESVSIVMQSPSESYTLSVECGKGGSTDMDGYSVLGKGTPTAVRITPDDGKTVSSITVNGTAYPVSDTIEIDGSESSYSIVVTFDDASYSISGYVADSLGGMLSGVTVTAESMEGGRYKAVSDVDGTYSIDGLPYGRYIMSAGEEGYAAQTLGTVDLKEDMVCDVTMFPDGTYAKVEVSCGEGGTASPGTSLFGIGSDVTVTITADELYLIKDVVLDGESLGAVDRVDIASISGDHTVKVTFERMEFTVLGTVESFEFGVDTGGVRIRMASDTYVAVVYSDEDGKFSLKVPFGRYTLSITKEGMVSSSKVVNVTSDREVAVFYESMRYIIGGSVTDQNGTLIGGADVSVNGEYRISTTTTGRFSVECTYGMQTITVTMDGYAPAEIEMFVNKGNGDTSIVMYALYSVDTECTNGTVTGSGTVKFNDSFTVSYSPADGYVLSAITVDGSEIGISGYEESYTFSNIDRDHSVSVTFVPEEFTVTFLNYDGSVISKEIYAYGSEITVPADPVREGDDDRSYRFTGWDPEVSEVCVSDATYTATFASVKKDGAPATTEIAAVLGIAVMALGSMAVLMRGRP